MINSYQGIFQGIRTVRKPLAQIYLNDDRNERLLYGKGTQTHICSNLVIPHTLKVLQNGLIIGKDNGQGKFHPFYENKFDKFELTYSNSVLNYKFGRDVYKDDIVTIEYEIDCGIDIRSESSVSYFHCAACGARNQKGRCYYCKSIPGLKER